MGSIQKPLDLCHVFSGREDLAVLYGVPLADRPFSFRPCFPSCSQLISFSEVYPMYCNASEYLLSKPGACLIQDLDCLLALTAVFITQCLPSEFPKPAVPTAVCTGLVGEAEAVTLKVKQILERYPDSNIECFLVYLCMVYIFIFCIL